MGINEHTKGYRCYCPHSKKIFISRDVRIDETTVGECTSDIKTNTKFPSSSFKICISSNRPGAPEPTPSPQSIPSIATDNTFPTIDGVIYPKIENMGTTPRHSSIDPDTNPENVEHVNSPLLGRDRKKIVTYSRRKPIDKIATVRKSTCTHAPSVRLKGFVNNIETSNLTYSEASKEPRWVNRMLDELKSLHDNQT